MDKFILVIAVFTTATLVTGQTTSTRDDPHAETEEELVPESEIIPDSEHETNESADDRQHGADKSEPDSEYLEGEGHHADHENEAEHEVTPEDWGASPENNPVGENGFLNLPFEFDGQAPNDYFVPGGERSEPTESNSEPEKTPEYWWENEPEYFYDDEYRYLNALVMGGVEAEHEGIGDNKAEPEGETEPEYKAEPEGRVEPEFEYLYTFKSDQRKVGTKTILHVLIAVLSVVCSILGGAILFLTYKGHKHYREAKLQKTEDHTSDHKQSVRWDIVSAIVSVSQLFNKQTEVST